MICLRCGHCCQAFRVVVIDDPELGPVEGNLIVLEGDGTRCRHLQGDEVGEYSCAVHGYDWYEGTPCAEFGQVEATPDSECRVGRFLIDKQESESVRC